MGSCSRRHFLLSICFLQTISIIERQVFDFLGYMWAPILANFFHIIFVIFGFYGSYLLSAKYLVTYLIWNVIWMGWNSFLICFYMDIGVLDKNSDILNLGTGSVSWFEVNGYGCKPTYPINITSEDPYRPVRPEHVDDCLIDYPVVEVIHSGIQFALSIFALIGAISMIQIFIDEDDRLNKINKNTKQRQSFYSIEFTPAADTVRGSGNNGSGRRIEDHILNMNDDHSGQLSPKPMTPRRVKRRSVMTRGTTSRQSNQSRRSHSSNNRNSIRNSRRKYHQNPVTKLIDQQHQNIKPFASFSHHTNDTHSNLTASNLKCLNTNLMMNSIQNNNGNCGSLGGNGNGGGVSMKAPLYYNNFSNSVSPNGCSDPIYYNTSTSTTQLQQSWNSSNSPTMIHSGGSSGGVGNSNGGHLNPTYQHSTPNLNNSSEHVDDLYNNRPPSVRSSYSNFHGTRPLSSYNPTTENVFVGISGGGGGSVAGGGAGGSGSDGGAGSILPTNIANNVAVSQPQVPTSTRRTASRESIRSMAFLNNGPPAYNLNYHTPPDSETTM